MIQLSASFNEFIGIDKAHEGATERIFRWVEAPELWVAFFLIAAILFGAIFIYRRETSGSLFWRMAAALFRALAITSLLLILFQPSFQSKKSREHRSSVAILLDTSLSMQLSDNYEDKDDQRQLALACGLIDKDGDFGAHVGEQLKKMTRMEILSAVFEKQGKGFLTKLYKDHPVRLYSFDRGTREITPVEGVQLPVKEGPLPDQWPLFDPFVANADGNRTEIVTALHEIMDTDTTRNLGGIILVTDGRSNSGVKVMNPGALDRVLSQEVPVYTVGIGDPHPPRDIELINVACPPKIQVDTNVDIKANFMSMGFEGKACPVLLSIVKKRAPGAQEWSDMSEVIKSDTVAVGPTPKQSQLLSFTHMFDETMAGEYILRIDINKEGATGELDGEITKNNNGKEFLLEVVSKKLKVLYIEGYPRWEYRYLSRALIRDKKTIDCWCFLFSAEANWAQECSPGLKSVVTRDEFNTLEQLAKYDVVILGDVKPAILPPEFQQSLTEFVRLHNGGVIFIAGEHYMPRDYREQQIDAKLLPVVLDENEMIGSTVYTEPFQPQLAALGVNSDITMLLNPEDFNQANITTPQLRELNRIFWENSSGRDDGLPGIYWFYSSVKEAVPGAEVLVQHPDLSSGQGGRDRLPIVAARRVGTGNVVYVGSDDFWRWRYCVDDLYHYRFYHNLIHYVTQGRLSASKRFEISVNKEQYDMGEKVKIRARALSSNLKPYVSEDTGDTSEEYTVWVSEGENEAQEITLKLNEAERDMGVYETELNPSQLGSWKVVIKALEGDTKEEDRAEARFTVSSKSLEDNSPKMDQETLTYIATTTGGRFFMPWEIGKIPELIDPFPRKLDGSIETDSLWDSAMALTLLLTFLGIEWVIRKWQRMA